MCIAQMRSASAFEQHTTPAVRSWCPPRYLVALCSTTSMPSACGFWFSGDAKVLSASVTMPRGRHSAAAAARSVSTSVGLAGLSSITRRVSGRSAASSAPASSCATIVTATPKRGSTSSNSLLVLM